MAIHNLLDPIAAIAAHSTISTRADDRGTEADVAAFLRSLSDLVGIPFVAVDKESCRVLAQTHSDSHLVLPDNSIAELMNLSRAGAWENESGLLLCAVEIPSSAHVSAVAVGWMLSTPNARPSEIVMAAAARGWTRHFLDAYLAAQPFCSRRFLEKSLESAVARLEQTSRESRLQKEVAHLGRELETTYEEITLLHSLARNLQVSRRPADIAEICLDGLQGRIDCEGTAIWIQPRDQQSSFLSRGKLPFDQERVSSLISRFENSDWMRPCVRNHIQETPLGADFPGLQNMVIVPIGVAPQFDGWILSWNLRNECEYGTVEASLLNSIATIFGTHLRNIELFRQNADLLLSFVRSLVSTLDAKDPYTRGHSERVALIARRIGEVLHLPEDDLKDIYLSGLLHDIGKIGVDDNILRKPGSLTSEEFGEIQKHPTVGFSILKGLKNLQAVLPGVRNHHESYNGTGYPDKLKGEDIPLIARILAVADSYDAMGSDRPYRKGMPIEKIHEILQRGAGNQWDEKVVEAYFSVANDISRICADYDRGDNSILGSQTDECEPGQA